jgi:hypothetical protein
MGRDLGIGLPIERSEANSDVVRIFRYARKYRRSATRTEAPPSTGRRLVFRNQIFASNYTVPLK